MATYYEELFLDFFERQRINNVLVQRFGYKPLSQNWISEMLLDETYIDIEDKIETIPKKIFLLNVISDQSNNMKDKQILNMTISTKDHHVFYTLLESAKDKHLDVSKNT